MNIKSTIGGVVVSAFFLGAGSLAAQAATEYWDTGQVVIGGVDQHCSVLGYVSHVGNPTNSNTPFSPTEPGYNPALGNAYTYSNGAYASGLNFISFASDGGIGQFLAQGFGQPDDTGLRRGIGRGVRIAILPRD